MKNLILFFLLLISLYICSRVFAVDDIIQYDYDNQKQLNEVIYDLDPVGSNDYDVNYLYDTSGNRQAKTTDISGATNNSPTAPSNTSPTDTAQDIPLAATLSWTASTDPDSGDTVLYDVYLSTTTPPELYRSGYSSTSITTLPLESFKTYYWKIVARDNHNAISAGSEWSFKTVYVPMPPTADAGSFYYGIEGQAVTLDGSASSDEPPGSITLYRWDIDNNGSYDYSSSLPTQNHVFAQQGTYAVKLQVTDDEGATDETVTSVIVSDTSPVATFTTDVTSGTEPLDVLFEDITVVYDTPVTRSWDFGDGLPGSIGGYPQTKTYRYVQDGIFTAWLVLQDFDNSDEELSIASTVITVDDTSPTADFTADYTYGSAPLTVVFTNNSTGYDQPLASEWDFDDNGTVDSTDTHPTHIFTDPGVYSVKLTITDNDGSPDTITKTSYITVCYPPANIVGSSTSYSLLQSAYDAAQDTDTIQSREWTFTEDFNVNRSISVTLEGGYDCLHSTNSGMTTIEGDMTVSDGTILNIENFNIDFIGGAAPLAPPGGGGDSVSSSPIPHLRIYIPTHATSTPANL